MTLPTTKFKIGEKVKKETSSYMTYGTVTAIQVWKDGEVRISTTFESFLKEEELIELFDNQEEKKYFS